MCEGIVVEIGRPGLNAECNFVSPEQTGSSIGVSDAFRIKTVVRSIVELINAKKLNALPLNQPGGIPKSCRSVISDSSKRITHP